MKQIFAVLLSILALASYGHAQAVPSATYSHIGVTVGGEGSIFQPDFAGNFLSNCYVVNSVTYCYPTAERSDYPLIGIGTFVDLKFSHWVQLEAEGRWQRFNQYQGIHQDNYLAGPRLPVYQTKKKVVYAKVLGGFTNMTFDTNGSSGRFTTIAFGGGMDMKIGKKLNLRAFDAEYHYLPSWGHASLSPYGVSMGLSYKLW